MKRGITVYGLQRSGTNYLAKLLEINFDIFVKNHALVVDGETLYNSDLEGVMWKHSMHITDMFDSSSPCIVLYKNPYLWIESLCFRHRADFDIDKHPYATGDGPDYLLAGPDTAIREVKEDPNNDNPKLNVLMVAQAYLDWHASWTDNPPSNSYVVKYDDMLIEETRNQHLRNIASKFNLRDIVDTYNNYISYVPESIVFTEDRYKYYEDQKPLYLTDKQISVINNVLGRERIERWGYEYIN